MPIPILVIGAVAAAGYLVYKRRPAPLDEPPDEALDDPAGWPRLLARATREEDWGEAARLHVRMAGLERGEARLAHLLQAARLYEERLGDADGAIRCYEEVLLVNPDDSEALAGLAFLKG